MEPSDLLDALRGDLPAPGTRVVELHLAPWTLVLEGLPAALAHDLARRWGDFAVRGGSGVRLPIRVRQAPERTLLERWRPAEQYRLEGGATDGGVVARSYGFLCGRADDGRWLLALSQRTREPAGRAVENAVRYVVARLAAEAGGFAMHGAGVVREGRGYVFAGPSGSGKTTVVALSSPAESLGDDFAVALPGTFGWQTIGLPFDNSERGPLEARTSPLPLAGIWRLHQAAAHRIVRPKRPGAAASLMACVAFPWALPDLSEALLLQVGRFLEESRYEHLHFSKDAGFWPLLLTPRSDGGT